MPKYNLNGKTYNIPDNLTQKFESENPNATVSYMVGRDQYNIPVSKRDKFLKKFPEASIGEHTNKKEETSSKPAHKNASKPVQPQGDYLHRPLSQQTIAEYNMNNAPVFEASYDAGDGSRRKVSEELSLTRNNNEFTPVRQQYVDEKGEVVKEFPVYPYQPSEVEYSQRLNELAKQPSLEEQNRRRLEETERQLSEERDKEQRQQNEAMMNNWPMFIAQAMNVTGGSAPGSMQTATDATERRRLLEARQHLLSEGRDIIRLVKAETAEAGEGGETGLLTDVKRGLRGTASNAMKKSTWDFGATELNTQAKLLETIIRMDNGLALTNDERELLDDFALKAGIDQLYGEQLSGWAKAGQTTGDAFGYMFEMLLNPANRIVGAVRNGAMKYAMKKYGEKWVKNRTKSVIAKKMAVSGLSTIGGVLGGGATMAVTSGALKTVANADERMIGNAVTGIDDNGEVFYFGREDFEDNPLTAFGKAIASQTFEYGSEMAGEFLPAIHGFFGRMAGRAVVGKKGREALRLTGDLSGVSLNRAQKFVYDVTAGRGIAAFNKGLDKFLKKTQWHGPIEEYEEEVLNNLGSVLIGDMTFDAADKTGFFNPELNFETFCGVAFMGGGISAWRTGAYAVGKFRNRESKVNARNEKLFGDEWNTIRESINVSADDTQALNGVLTDIVNSPLFDKNQKKAVLDYTARLMESKGAEMASFKPRMVDSNVSKADEGYTVTSFDRNGLPIDIQTFDTDEQAKAYQDELKMKQQHQDFQDYFKMSSGLSYGESESLISEFLGTSEPQWPNEDAEAQFLTDIQDPSTTIGRQFEDFKLQKRMQKAQASRDAIAAFEEENGWEAGSVKWLSEQDPMRMSNELLQMADQARAFLEGMAYPANEVHTEHEQQAGAEAAQAVVENVISDEAPIDPQNNAGQQIYEQYTNAKNALDELFAREEDLAQEFQQLTDKGLSPQEVISSLSSFRPADVQTVIDYYNAEARHSSFMQEAARQIDNVARRNRERRTFHGTIDGSAGSDTVIGITDGTGNYTLVSGNVTTDGGGNITGSDSGLIIGLDDNGNFVNLGDKNISIVPGAMTLDQWEDIERQRLQEQVSMVIDPNGAMMQTEEQTDGSNVSNGVDVPDGQQGKIVYDGNGGSDSNGNRLNSDGSIYAEPVKSVNEITDDDFDNPNRSVELPTLSDNIANAIGTNGKPIIIKKNIFEKNSENHPELDADDSREILSDALYRTNLVGQTQPITRPDYKVAIHTGDRNSVVVLDIYHDNKQVEIVGWRRINGKGLAKMQRQAEREGGQFLILSPVDGSAAALSALPHDLSSAGKDTNISETAQENERKISEITDKDGVKRYENGIDVDTAIADIQADGLDVDETADIAIAEAADGLGKIKPPKTRAEQVKSARKRAELQNTIDYYTGLKQRFAEMKSEENVNVDGTEEEIEENSVPSQFRGTADEQRQARIQALKSAFGELFDDDFTKANDVYELVSMWIGRGRKLAWDDVNGRRGLQKELGWTRKIGGDTRFIEQLLARKGDGMGVDEFVHAVWESPQNDVNGERRYTTEEIKEALLDLLRSAESKSDVVDYALNTREAQARAALEEQRQRAAEAAEEAASEQQADEAPAAMTDEQVAEMEYSLPFERPTDEDVPDSPITQIAKEIEALRQEEGMPEIRLLDTDRMDDGDWADLASQLYGGAFLSDEDVESLRSSALEVGVVYNDGTGEIVVLSGRQTAEEVRDKINSLYEEITKFDTVQEERRNDGRDSVVAGVEQTAAQGAGGTPAETEGAADAAGEGHAESERPADDYLTPRNDAERQAVAAVEAQLGSEIAAAEDTVQKARGALDRAQAAESDRATDMFSDDKAFETGDQLFGFDEMGGTDRSPEGVVRRTRAEREALQSAENRLGSLQSQAEHDSRVRGALDDMRRQTSFDADPIAAIERNADAFREEQAERNDVANEPSETVYNTSDGHAVRYRHDGELPEHSDGDFTLIEREFRENGYFGFSGGRIESSDDVAYIFRNLEDSAIEHAFVVLVKDGEPRIIHIGMGAFTSSPVNAGAIRAAYDAFGADEIYFVHNHPSGQLKASRADEKVLDSIVSMFENEDVFVNPGIIMNLKSGKYGTFYNGTIEYERNSEAVGEERELSVLEFDKQVFAPDYDITNLGKISSSEDIAAFLTSHRLGERDKLSVLILNHQMEIVGNMALPYNGLQGDINEIGKTMASAALRYGGVRVVPYGNFELSHSAISALRKSVETASGNTISVMDAVSVENGLNYKSAYEYGAMEPSSDMTSGYSEELEAENLIDQHDFLFGNNYVVSITGNEFQKDERPLTERVAEHYANEYGGQVEREGFGTVYIDKAGVKDSLSHGIGRTKAAAFAAVPHIIKDGIQIDHQDNYKGRNRESFTIAAPVEIGGKGYVGVVIVTRGKGTERNKFYLHEVVLQENLLNESIKTDTKADSHKGDVANILRKIASAKESPQNLVNNNTSEGYNETDNADVANVSNRHNGNKVRIRRHIENLLRKLGTRSRTTVITSINGVRNKERRAHIEKAHREGRKVYGWFENGRVFLYLPDIDSVYKAEQTIWHETVAHVGLRELVGAENYGRLLRRLWMEHQDKAMGQWVTERMQTNGWSLEKAIDEWLAREAEQVVAERQGRRTLWQKLRGWLGDMLREIGYRTRPTLTDVRYLFWLSENQLREGEPMSAINRAAFLQRLDQELAAADIRPLLEHSAEVDSGYSEDIDNPLDYSAKALYERRVNTVNYVFTEAYQDGMIGLKTGQEAIVNGKQILDSQDAYTAENRMHGTVKNAGDIFNAKLRNPIIESINKIISVTGMGWNDVDRYVYTKHGLERNREFFVRDWLENARKKKGADLDKLNDIEARWAAERIRLFTELKAGSISLADYLGGLTDFIKTEIDTEYDPSKHDYSGFRAMFGNEKGEYDEADVVMELIDTEGQIGGDLADELWERIGAANDYMLELYREAGMRSDEQIDRLKQMFHWYVPLRGFKEETGEDVYQYFTGRGNPNDFVGSLLKHAEGRGSEAKFPISTLFSMAYNTIVECERNKVKQKFYRLCQANPNDLVVITGSWAEYNNKKKEWVVAYPELTEDMTDEQVRQATLDFEQRMKEMEAEGTAKRIKAKEKFDYRPADKANTREHIVEVRINGETRRMTVVGNPRMAQALNGKLTFRHSDNIVSKWNAQIKNFMSATFTSYSPTFVGRNMARDFGHLNMMLLTREGKGYTAAADSYYVESFTKMKGMFERYREGKLDMSNEMERDFKDFMDNGGVTGFSQMSKVDDIQKEMKKLYKQQKKGKPVELNSSMIGRLFEGIEALNEAIENNARFATYRASRHYAGRTKARSATDAKEITVNFNRKGAGSNTKGFKSKAKVKVMGMDTGLKVEMLAKLFGFTSQVLNEGVIFFNAAVQGIATTFKNFRNSDGSWNKKYISGWAVKYASLPFAVGMLMPVINKMLAAWYGYDDDDDPYANLPEWTRRNNWCILTPLGFVTIPISPEQAAFCALGDMIAGNTYSPEMKPLDRNEFSDFVGIMNTFVPVEIESKVTKGGLMEDPIDEILGRTFSVLAPLVAVGENIGWTGRPIYREDVFNNDKYKPEYQMVYSNVNPMLVSVSEKLNEWTGGDDVKRGWWQLNPAVLQYVLEQYTGGAGKFIANVGSMAADGVKMAMGEETEDFNIRTVDFVRAFFQQPDDRTQYYRTNAKFRKYKEDAEKIKSWVDDYKRDAAVNPYHMLQLEEMSKNQAVDLFRMQYIYGVPGSPGVEKELKEIRETMNAAKSIGEKKKLRKYYNEAVKKAVETLDNMPEILRQNGIAVPD